jgi:hypothetical protein
VPLANPSASFDVAVRHLFRHLDEPDRLRRNPLVRRFFEDGSGRVTHAREKAALAAIVRVVGEGAERARRQDMEANQGERAYRQHTILRRTYFERVPIERVAADLGLSTRQYYRERAAICARVARYVEAYDHRPALSAPFSRLDPLQFQMEQALQRQELGDVEAASRAYALVLRSAAAAATKIDALCRLADVATERGHDDAAAVYLRDARALFAVDSYEMTPMARAATWCQLALMRSRCAWQTGRAPRAARALTEAYRLASTILPEGGKRARELCVDVLLERAERNENLGDFGRALADVRRAAELQRYAPEASLRQRSDVVRLRTLLEMTAPEPLATPAESFEPLCEAMRLARAAGSAKRAVLVTAWLAAYHLYAENEPMAADAGARALAMVEHIASPRFRAATRLIVADALVLTRYWRRVPRILAAARGTLVEGSFEWAKLKHFEAEYQRRSGRMLESHVAAVESERHAVTFGSRRLRGAILRGFAHSAHAFGEPAEAKRYIDQASSLLERHGSALSRTITRLIAAQIA